MMKWTLEEAKRDYRANNPDCKNCKFSKLETWEAYGKYYHNYTCLVKETALSPKANIASKCKYYTCD